MLSLPCVVDPSRPRARQRPQVQRLGMVSPDVPTGVFDSDGKGRGNWPGSGLAPDRPTSTKGDFHCGWADGAADSASGLPEVSVALLTFGVARRCKDDVFAEAVSEG